MSLVFFVVVALRLLIPLGIPRYPLPAIIGSLVIDAADQTIFQTFGGLPSNYQDYDKALDIYYLVVAYSATFRNWDNDSAFQIGRFLWYYRLIGVVAFEFSGSGFLLLIFPNTFEYYFIAFEVIRTRWDPDRLSRRFLIKLAAAIWIFIKLPQEWWIHVANLDVTDEASRHPVIAALVAGLLVVLLAIAWLNRKRLPAADWPLTFRVDALLPPEDTAWPTPSEFRRLPFWSSVMEKIVLVGLITMIFGHVLHVVASNTQIVVGVAIFVVVNAAVSHALATRGTRWRTTAIQFLAMAAINSGIVLVLALTRGHLRRDVQPDDVLFFVLLLTLIVTLYDRYRTMRERRLRHERSQAHVEKVARGGVGDVPVNETGKRLSGHRKPVS